MIVLDLNLEDYGHVWPRFPMGACRRLRRGEHLGRDALPGRAFLALIVGHHAEVMKLDNLRLAGKSLNEPLQRFIERNQIYFALKDGALGAA